MRVLAIDVGDKRFGLAVSDPMGIIATPVGALTRRVGKRIPMGPLLAKADELGAEAFVIGLPLDGDGNDLPRAAEARWLAGELTRRTGKRADLVDERFTTARARRAVHEMDGAREMRDRRGDVDALAATLLLQGALDAAR